MTYNANAVTDEPCLLLGTNGNLTIGVTRGSVEQTTIPCAIKAEQDRFKGINQATGEVIFDFSIADEPTKSAVENVFIKARTEKVEPQVAIWFMTEDGMHPFQHVIPA